MIPDETIRGGGVAWIDQGVTPPRRLPLNVDEQARYLAEALGHPIYERWTWTRLLQQFAALPDARCAKPAVCKVLLDASEAVEYWQRGRLRVEAGFEAPAIELIVEQARFAHRRRFRRIAALAAEDTPLVSSPTVDVPDVALRGLLPVSMNEWLQRQGRFANPDRETNSLGATDDHSAVVAFLRERASRSRHTWRAYVSELTGLTQWCLATGRGPLSALSRQDLLVYRDAQRHGAAPDPGSEVVPAPTRSASAQTRTMAVVASLFRFWHRTGYLSVNPAAGLTAGARSRNGFSPKRMVSRALLERCDQWVRSTTPANDVRHLAETSDAVREWRRVVIWSLYRVTGARLAELAWREDTATPSVSVDDQGNWTLHVVGKGDKERPIPLPSWCADVLKGYRVARGLPPQPAALERIPLIHGERRSALGASGLYDEEKAVLTIVASKVEPEDASAAVVLRSVSPHWLRHAYAQTLVVEHAVPLPAVQALMGHASVQTTAEYARADLSKLREFVERGFANVLMQ